MDHISKVVDLIQEKDPPSQTSNGEVEINANKLNTLIALRKLVDGFGN